MLTNEMIIKRIDEENETDVSIALDTFRNEMIEIIEKLFNVHIKDRSKRLDWKTWDIDELKFDEHRKRHELFDGFGLMITGSALIHAFSDELKMKFIELCTMCKSVICCRMTPLQKAQVVDLLIKNANKITLAIGDGANDVSMLQSEWFSIRSCD
jgi:magnesium-transporting ATPase (P-type)